MKESVNTKPKLVLRQPAAGLALMALIAIGLIAASASLSVSRAANQAAGKLINKPASAQTEKITHDHQISVPTPLGTLPPRTAVNWL